MPGTEKPDETTAATDELYARSLPTREVRLTGYFAVVTGVMLLFILVRVVTMFDGSSGISLSSNALGQAVATPAVGSMAARAVIVAGFIAIAVAEFVVARGVMTGSRRLALLGLVVAPLMSGSLAYLYFGVFIPLPFLLVGAAMGLADLALLLRTFRAIERMDRARRAL